MRRWLESVWYGRGRGGWLLRPLAVFFGMAVLIRRLGYASGLLRRYRLPRPVVVIGNLTVGGTGKTPVIVHLAERLEARGLRVGVVSRGYGGSETKPRRVTVESDPRAVGDEPCLIARRTKAKVAIGRDRVAAARVLAPEVDLILADDGLQHYRLERDLEIVVVDHERGFGNGRLLPAGPLREPLRRLQRVPLLIGNGGAVGGQSLAMTLEPTAMVRIHDRGRSVVADWAGQRVHAVAGIGHPERFFATLLALNVEVIVHPFPDHALYRAEELQFGDELPIVMTEKDAVKCTAFAGPLHWYLEVAACFSDADALRLDEAVLAVLGPQGQGDG